MKRKYATIIGAVLIVTITCLTLVFTLNGVGNGSKTLTLVENGKSDYVIIVPESSWGRASSTAEGAEFYSANDLQKYIENMTGVTIPVMKDSEVPIAEDEKVISVGMTNREGVRYTVDRDSIGEDGYTIKTVGNSVYIAGGRPRGTGYAVYDFLENYFGCKFYSSTLITWPSYETLTLEEIEDNTFVPEFTVRMLNGNSYTNSEFGAGGTASKANSQYGLNAVYGDRMTFAYRSGDWRFVHTINHLADIDPDYNYGETYECPECNTAYDSEDYIPGTTTRWSNAGDGVICPTCGNATFKDFILHQYNASGIDVSGYIDQSNEPSGHVRFQPCLTGLNPFTGRNIYDEVVEGSLRWLRESAEAGHVNDRLISVSQHDASWQYGGCECASCKAMENITGSAAGNWIWLCNQVAEAVKDDYPQITVNTISYLYTVEAPVNIKAADNVSVFLCTNDYCAAHPWNECGVSLRYVGASDMTKRVSEWQEVCDHLYGYDYYRSMGDDRWIYPIQYQIYYNYKWYHDLGFEGVYSYMLTEQDNFCGLNVYLAGKMMWNPDMTFEEYQALIDDYCFAAYGPGGDSISEIIKLYHERSSENCWSMCTTNYFDIMPSSSELKYEYMDGEITNIYAEIDTSFVDKVQSLFNDAFTKAETTEQIEAIEKEYINFCYYKLRDLHDIMSNGYYMLDPDFDMTAEEINTEIYNTADKLIELLVKYNIDEIGYDAKDDSSHSIDLSNAADFDRMQLPENW
ncbi:MAG: DUF4838 domain-containing protein [Clostridiales bacterium]|nr:DUF4838 domain-containing protein [Clostridiales bacterium]